MSTIRVLSEEVSNRIAAGEVIERPAAVVKELIENSLDAGATHITIHIVSGGKRLIRIVDNGYGMDPEDALLCLEPHATSKIKHTQDIEKINTFGFRGEALPSIASVSHLELRTKPDTMDIGTEVLVKGGVISKVSKTGSPTGTSMTVKNIFYNLPARRKFLRSTKTEETVIQETILLAALANKDVGFQVYYDNRLSITVDSQHNLCTRAMLLFGKETVSSMLQVNYSEDDVSVTGLIARPGISRSSRREQRVFVNNRAIISSDIYYAIKEAYHTLVMKGRFPPVILFIDLPAKLVDCNVHPAKREVRFRYARMIGSIVERGIRQSLRELATLSVSPTSISDNEYTSSSSKDRKREGSSHSTTLEMPKQPASASPDFGRNNRQQEAPSRDEKELPFCSSSSEHKHKEKQSFQDGMLFPKETSPTSPSIAVREEMENLKILGALKDMFLLAEGSQGLVLIDQHAAHERILFEQVLQEAEEKNGAKQGLLIPITMDVSERDTRLLQKHSSYWKMLGFDIEAFGKNTIIVHSIPYNFPQENIPMMIRDILDELEDAPLLPKRVDIHKIAQVACKAAVKASDHLHKIEISQLLHDLLNTKLPYTCPHGRPTMINISFRELERRFGRKH